MTYLLEDVYLDSKKILLQINFYDKFEILKLTGPDSISKIYSKAPKAYGGKLLDKKFFSFHLISGKKGRITRRF